MAPPTCPRASLRQTYRLRVLDADWPERLRAFGPPVLLATGTGTSPFRRDIIHTLAAAFPRSRVIELNAGHAPQLVSAEAFFGELQTFLGEHD